MEETRSYTIVYLQVLFGRVNGNDIVDIYQVGKKPKLNSGYSPYRDKIIIQIDLDIKDYTTAAFVYYADGSFQYLEKIQSYATSTQYSS